MDPHRHRRRPHLTRHRGAAALFAGTLAGNALAYLFFLILSRVLSAPDLGAIGALVNVFTVTMVPGLGLQLAAARAVAPLSGHQADPEQQQAVAASMVRAGLVTGLVLAGALAAVSAPLASILHLTSVWPVLALAGCAVPTTITYAALGVLQGQERLERLGLGYLLAGLARIPSAFFGVAGGLSAIMGQFALGWVVTAALTWVLVLGRPRPRRRAQRQTLAVWSGRIRAQVGGLAARSFGPGARLTKRAVAAGVRSAIPVSGVLMLTSVDVILARHHLPEADSGAYAVGALFEKVAFWGPGFLATAMFARLSRPTERSRALALVTGATLALGAVGVGVAALLADRLSALVAGDGFGHVGPFVWLFTALGVLQALVQVFVYADVASGSNRAGAIVWLALPLVTVAVALGERTIGAIVLTLLTMTTCLLVGLALSVVVGRPTVRSTTARALGQRRPQGKGLAGPLIEKLRKVTVPDRSNPIDPEWRPPPNCHGQPAVRGRLTTRGPASSACGTR